MPHPSLALRHLSKLPVALRRRANAALDGNTGELRALNNMIQHTGPTAANLLPMYYAGLDASEIPSLLAQILESELQHDPTLVAKLSHVVMCLAGITFLHGNRRLPGAACADIWQRAWPWIEFLGTHRDTLPHLLPLSEVNLLCVVDVLARDNEDTAALIRETPGFRVFLFRAWALSFDQARLTPILPAFHFLCILLQDLPLYITDEHHFEEAIEGSGGNITLLACLAVNHIKCAVQSSVVSVGVVSMRSVVLILHARCWVDASFRQILIDEGIVTALTSSACRLSSAPFDAQDQYFNVSWAIQYYLTAPFGHNTFTQALRAGLLRAILAWGRMNPPKPQTLEQLNAILEPLSMSLVFLSNLSQLRTAVTELGIPIDGHTFRGFPISEKWEAFWSILESRWALMDVHLKREKETVKSGCSNAACCLIAPRSELKLCSGCKVCIYCSKECQKLDWRHGGHRAMCDRTGGPENNVTRRDRSFFRALLDDDYSKLKHSILMKELAYMRSNPGTEFYVRFDYCTPYSPCEVSIEAVSSFELTSDIWRYNTKRARESGGRIQIHVMHIADGGYGVMWVFPLNSATAECREVVQALAAQTAVGDGHEQAQADRATIKCLAELDILEVHV
ncbi:hypothetical protein GGX14DRAFT_484655 [Mycena pura]|uniref:MYND-type domain-containing protein n=1 Tax=Mycena pura TaxID=153505 RepID=A0AAD6UKR3_9AGAR|nr:hypothetical protein GGX14DRAFT_484655 [Mycena pura]